MTIDANQVTLFVVEDDDIDYMTIKRSFKKMKIVNPLVRAKDGQEALEQLEANMIRPPFIMLLDLQMPRLSGLDLLAKLRHSAQLKDTVVFVLTTSADERDIFDSYQHNVAGYFVKDEVGREFLEVLALLDGYWRIVHMPGEKQ
ncbi:response regulator [Pseudoalteromonas ardens]|uniref:Chemotaxis protein CheY n=1 Tax=Pseudoalteromonas rubra TaxID=43658 RepID=A0A0L0ETT1_9GAMM|nr:response regulator [Pseudoalteromonas sp. R96]KNC67811.1 chemotaxis protein CheY [Pseudoalteromonas rubra]MDK1313159.1 response regulator [Pseudoalteromonas sp. R96]